MWNTKGFKDTAEIKKNAVMNQFQNRRFQLKVVIFSGFKTTLLRNVEKKKKKVI